MAIKLDIPNLDQLIRRYVAGTSLKQLSDESGYSRPLLLRRLTERGVPIRNRSTAETLKWSRLKLDRRAVERQCGGAWAANRGRVRQPIEKLRAAATLFRRATRPAGRYEVDLLVMLSPLYSPTDLCHQFAVGPYNVDLAVRSQRVAVEVMRFHHRKANSTIRRERLEYLLRRGWSVLVVFVVQKRTLELLPVAQQIHAFVQQARLDPSGWGQYGVIGRDGQSITPPRYQLPRATRIEGF